MGQLTAYAKSLAAELKGAGINATAEVRRFVPPGVLVVPVPSRNYDIHHGYTATWRLVAMAGDIGDLRAAEALEDLVDRLAETLPIETAEAGSYRLPNANDPVPAYICTYTTEVESHADQGQ